MSRPTSDAARSVLVGWGQGATPPSTPTDGTPARHVWLDGTACVTLLAPPGTRFDDEDTALAWARRAWVDLSDPDDGSPAPEPVAWRCGRGRGAVVGVTWSVVDLTSRPGVTVAPLWAGVLAAARRELGPGTARLVVAEGRALTLIDVDGGVPVRWSTLALARSDTGGLAAVCAGAPSAVWLAGHSLPGAVPDGCRLLPGLGQPDQPPTALLEALHDVERAEPQLRRRSALSGRVAAALMLVAVVVMGVAAVSAWDAHQTWRAAQDRAEARARLADEGRARQRHRASADAAAWQRLQQPWAARWLAAEAAAPTDGGWLRLEQRRDGPLLVLTGESDTPSEALAVMRRISASPGVAEARLLRSEAQGASTRARFEIGVRIAGAAP